MPVILTGLLLALYFYKDSFLNFFSDNQTHSFAEVTALRNDVRRKDSKSIDFKSVEPNEPIFHGDSLSTGASSTAQVTFKSGQVLNVDQNSLIIFDDVTDTPEFVRGNIKITVKGIMKLKIDKEIIEIDGGKTRSDVQIYKDEKAKTQKIVLLSGDAQIQTPEKKEFIPLQINIPVVPKKVILADELLQDTPVLATETESVSPILGRAPVAAPGHYKLYDYYSRLLSSDVEFARNNGFSLRPNYTFKDFTSSTITIAPETTNDDTAQISYVVRIADTSAAQGYIVELSSDEYFSDRQTQYTWKNSYFTQKFSGSGNYYLRYRKVLEDQFLTDYSPTEKIFVKERPKPIAAVKTEPVVALKPIKEIVVAPAKINREPKPSLEVNNPVSSPRRAVAVAAPVQENISVEMIPTLQPYQVRRFSIDLNNRFSAFSANNENAATRAKLLTTRDLNLKLAWRQELSTQWQSAFTLGLRNLNFAPTDGGLSNIERQEKWLMNLQASLSYNVNPKLSTYIGFGFSQEAFLRELESPTISIDAVIVPNLAIGANYWLANRQSLDFGLNAQGQSYFAGLARSYSVDPGYGIHSAFILRHQTPLRDISAGIGYSYKNQGSSNTRQTEAGPFLFLNSTFSGKKEKK